MQHLVQYQLFRMVDIACLSPWSNTYDHFFLLRRIRIVRKDDIHGQALCYPNNQINYHALFWYSKKNHNYHITLLNTKSLQESLLRYNRVLNDRNLCISLSDYT